MPDLLVKLYELPPLAPALARSEAAGVTIRRARAFERTALRRFIEKHFTTTWADEAEAGFATPPVRVHVATMAGEGGSRIVGFAAHDCTALGFFGPTGVDETLRGKGIGAALLLASLHAMREAGYGYAIIGGAGPVAFYERFCGATVIPGSTPGIYDDMLAKSPG